MRTSVRFLLSLIIASAVELLFIWVSVSILNPPRQEVNRVIRISLVHPEKNVEKIHVEKRSGKSREETKRIKKTPPPKLTSRKAKREVARKNTKESRKRGGSLRPLEGNLPVSYVDAVKRAIEESIFYPLEAIEKGIEGPVIVQFSLNRKGKAIECKAVSGKEILTEATCMAIKKATFPPIPHSIKNDRISFQLQIEFNLRKAIGN